MSNIRIDLDTTIFDGQSLTFKSPCDCSDITGLIIYYPGVDGVQVSQQFSFTDAHGHNVGNIDELFAEDVLVKIILDTTTYKAFVQNADTNAYLEGKFEDLNDKYTTLAGYGLGNVVSKDWNNVDNLKTTGWYRFSKENDGIIIDGNHSVTYAFMQVSSFNESHAVQTLYPLIAIDKTYNPVLIRHCRGSVWEDWKWVTPLNKHNVEYLTTEYFNGKPVYTMLYSFTPASSKTADAGLPNTCTVIRSFIKDKYFSIPYKISSREVNAFVEINGGDTRYSETGNNVDGNVVYTQIWYTKG